MRLPFQLSVALTNGSKDPDDHGYNEYGHYRKLNDVEPELAHSHFLEIRITLRSKRYPEQASCLQVVGGKLPLQTSPDGASNDVNDVNFSGMIIAPIPEKHTPEGVLFQVHNKYTSEERGIKGLYDQAQFYTNG